MCTGKAGELPAGWLVVCAVTQVVRAIAIAAATIHTAELRSRNVDVKDMRHYLDLPNGAHSTPLAFRHPDWVK